MQKTATIDVDPNMLIEPVVEGTEVKIRTGALGHLDSCAKYTGTDLFLLKPRADCGNNLAITSSGNVEPLLDQRYRVSVYGDAESVEHCKTRVLMMVDQIVSWTSYVRGAD